MCLIAFHHEKIKPKIGHWRIMKANMMCNGDQSIERNDLGKALLLLLFVVLPHRHIEISYVPMCFNKSTATL
jgi:hypothetical protein